MLLTINRIELSLIVSFNLRTTNTINSLYSGERIGTRWVIWRNRAVMGGLGFPCYSLLQGKLLQNPR